MAPDSDKPWSRERARDIRETFAAIIGKARELSVDFLFIAGDLFHRQPLLKDLKEVNYLFSTIPDVRVVLIAGNHDRVRKKLCCPELYLGVQCDISGRRGVLLRLF